MIVKNESRVIERLLASVVSIIDSYCICDTGSTDNTIDIITSFFNGVNIPGKIIKEPFRDFGYNRSFALREAMKMNGADYILLLDADMILKKHPTFCVKTFKKTLTADAYFLLQGNDVHQYKNVRLVKNNPAVYYWGVTHEYVKLPETSVIGNFEWDVLCINDVGDGGAKKDKFERDIRLLEQGLIDEPNNDRYTFYLANSYRDAGHLEKAIETYKKRIMIGGWREEVWHSYYSAGECYEKMGDIRNAIIFWMDGFDYYPERIENLHKIITYYRVTGKTKLAYYFYDIAKRQIKNKTFWDHLFLSRDVYEYKLDYELSIIAYYYNPDNYDISNLIFKVLSHPRVDEHIARNLLSNYKFIVKPLKQYNTLSTNSQQYKVLESIGDSVMEHIDLTKFVSSTPSITMDKSKPNELIVNLRYVNYRINENGGYVNQEKIETINVVAVINTNTNNYPKDSKTKNASAIKAWEKTDEFVLDYNKSLDDLYVGLEDVRLFLSNGDLHFNANRGFREKIMVEYGNVNLRSKKTYSNLVTMPNQQRTEKNWVLFKNNETSIINMIYGWHPLVIGHIDERKAPRINDNNERMVELKVTDTIETPGIFKYLRGSTNGVNIGGEIWFIGHVVSYEDRRYYYHMFVVLDAGTYKVKKYTKLFTFEQEKVEYTLGFAYFRATDEFMIGYSVMDRETKYMTIPKSCVDDLMYVEG